MIWIILIGCAAIIIGFGAFFGAPYLPSKRREVALMFDTLSPLSNQDVVLDVGCGDGVVLREVSRRGARAIGVEINPFFVAIAKVLSRGDDRVSVYMTNFWYMKFPEATTFVYAFSTGRDAKRLMRKMQQEANRLTKPLVLVCLGNPLPGIAPIATYRAYAKYMFEPLQVSEA